MSYDTTKPLGINLENYLGVDLDRICAELVMYGIVFESQFESISSMVCKQNSADLVDLFAKTSQLRIKA